MAGLGQRKKDNKAGDWRGPYQPHPGTQLNRYRCSLPGLAGFTASHCGRTDKDHHNEPQQQALLGGGKSLLPSGIREVRGHFGHGDSVVVLNEESEELGVGMVNYDAGDIRKIMGLKTTEIESILGFRHDDEVIHRDNLVITRNLEEREVVCL